MANRKIGDIQILRAFAVLGVVVFHSHYKFLLPSAFQNTSSGVYFFFVISGFVIALTSKALLERVRNTASFVSVFMVKRAARILPAAIAWLVFYAMFFAWLGNYGFWQDYWQIVTLRFNYYRTPCCVGVYWSLVAEEHFYLAFALLFPLAVRWRLLVPISIAGIVLTVFIFRPLALPYVGQTQALLDHFFAGILVTCCASASRIVPAPGQNGAMRLLFATLALALLALIGMMFQLLGTKGYTPLVFASAAVIYIASADRDVVVPIPYVRDALIWIGERSYSIYLSHLLVLALDGMLDSALSSSGPSVIRASLYLIAVSVVGDLSYRFIERPGERWGRDAISRMTRSDIAYADRGYP